MPNAETMRRTDGQSRSTEGLSVDSPVGGMGVVIGQALRLLGAGGTDTRLACHRLLTDEPTISSGSRYVVSGCRAHYQEPRRARSTARGHDRVWCHHPKMKFRIQFVEARRQPRQYQGGRKQELSERSAVRLPAAP